jgi:hypothetical protein
MERLDRTAVNVLKGALDRQPLTEAKVAFAWAIAAGPALARAASVSWNEGSLTVTAKSATWQREFERARPVIFQRMRQLLGEDAVRESRIVSATPNDDDRRFAADRRRR